MSDFDPTPASAPKGSSASSSGSAGEVNWNDLPGLFRELGPVAVLAVAWTTLPPLALILILALLGPVSEWMRANEGLGLAAFLGFFAFGAGLGLSPTHALALLGGWTFGFARGSGFVLIGIALGSTIGFVFSKAVGRARIAALLARDRRGTAVREALIGRGALRTAGVVALLRVSPSSPFAVSNLIFGSSGTSFLPYLLGSVVGLMPRTLLVVSAGAAGAASGARDIVGLVKEGPGWLALVAGIALLVGSLMVVSALAQRALRELDLRPRAGGPN